MDCGRCSVAAGPRAVRRPRAGQPGSVKEWRPLRLERALAGNHCRKLLQDGQEGCSSAIGRGSLVPIAGGRRCLSACRKSSNPAQPASRLLRCQVALDLGPLRTVHDPAPCDLWQGHIDSPRTGAAALFHEAPSRRTDARAASPATASGYLALLSAAAPAE